MSTKRQWITVVLLLLALLTSACAGSKATEPAQEPTAPPLQETVPLQTVEPTAAVVVSSPTAEAAQPTAVPVTPPQQAQPPLSLEGVEWLLESYAAAGAMTPVLAGSQVTALFQNREVSGKAGCNSYFAGYSLDGSQLTISAAGSTMMACPSPEGIMQQESTYLALLSTVASFQITDGKLTLVDGSGKPVLIYTAASQSAQPAASLQGVTWVLQSMSDGISTVSTPIAGTQLTAIFGEMPASGEAALSGSAGCNTYNTSYWLAGDQQMTIGLPATTRMFCEQPAGAMQQENTFLASLNQVAKYQILGQTLELYNAGGQMLLAFAVEGSIPAPAAPAAPVGTTGAGLTAEALKNATYKTGFTSTGSATLVNGEYTEEIQPGAASKTQVLMTEFQAFGELPDGETAAAVVLASNSGGSGVFYELALVLDVNSQPVNVATAFLGDRVQINSISFEEGQIVVDMVTHRTDDPMCCPTQRVIQRYAYQDQQLKLAANEPVGDGALTGVVWKWVQTQMNNDQLITISDPSQYTLEFLPGGKVSAKADCNQANGTYLVNGSSLAIEILTMTMAACPPGSQSDEFIKQLNGVASYLFQEGFLYLDIKFDTGTMKFTK